MKFSLFRYPKIVDNSTVPILRQWLARDKSGQGIQNWSCMGVDYKYFNGCTVDSRYLEIKGTL